MSFLQRKPQTDVVQQYYTLSSGRTILVVGLGNIGKQYDGTRHNIGFAAVDTFANANDLQWVEKKDMKCLEASGTIGDNRLICIKPTTLMNNSGEAVLAVSQFYKIALQDIIVVHDELDIPFGQVRMRIGGSPAGHNGIKSVSKLIGPEYGRVRLGIGPKSPPQIDSADFVLGRFNKEQAPHVSTICNEVNSILNEIIFGGELVVETRQIVV